MESRAAKLTGAQKKFKGKLLSDLQQERMLNFEDEEREIHSHTVDAKELAERAKYIKSLDK